MMEIKHVSYIYDKGLPFGTRALNDISMTIEEGAFIGITGKTGSGKSTLIRIMASLLEPTSGQLVIGEGKKVGLAFQFPEHQLFEETVLKDVMFGPRNLGLSDAKDRAIEALKTVGLDDSFLERSPFALSGGEQRMVAIAGVLAMDPDILILDEPTVGLDKAGHDLVMSILGKLNDEGRTIVLVSHEIEDILDNCKEMVLLSDGCIQDSGEPMEVLKRHLEIAPKRMVLVSELKRSGFDVDYSMDIEALALAIAAQLS
ncbi:MAG TPA: energy-coupling factor ABC transporter ATP-binding protein [Sphaerochaeta sp.]|nr:energy-coupling factor ABC transporter ATP-binding protein [Sphaerochaeta sp.]